MIINPLEAEIAEQLREARSLRRKELHSLRLALRRRDAELEELADMFRRYLQDADSVLANLGSQVSMLRREMEGE